MNEEKTRCKACKEWIWADATVCPQCQTHQTKELRKTVLLALKELSAITVIFTLIFAVMELNRFADSWFEDSAYVNRLAASASMLMDAGDYSGARKLLADAKKISPTSEEVNVLQMQLTMNSIRENGYPHDAAPVQLLVDSLDVLYHNLGRSRENDAAALTHIAWASYLLRDKGYADVDINLYLDKALALDGSYVYANAYKGEWYLNEEYTSPLKDSLTDAELTTKAQQYFKVALQQNIDSDYIRSRQYYGLRYGGSQASNAEYLKLVFTMVANNDAYFQKHQKRVLGDLFSKLYSAIDELVDSKDEYLENAFLRLSEADITTLKKLINPDDVGINAMFITLLAIARDYNGDDLSAIDGYISAYTLVEKTSYGLRYDIPTLLERICANTERLNPESIARCDDFFAVRVNPKHYRLHP